MTQLTQKQRKICDEFEAMCRSLQSQSLGTISASVAKTYASTFVHSNYGGGCYSDGLTMAGLADCIQSSLDKFTENNPSAGEAAKRRVAALEADLAIAKANMEDVCNV